MLNESIYFILTILCSSYSSCITSKICKFQNHALKQNWEKLIQKIRLAEAENVKLNSPCDQQLAF